MPDAIAIQALKQDIQQLRLQLWPPQPQDFGLQNVEGLPIYYAPPEQVHVYLAPWRELFERAYQLYYPLLPMIEPDAMQLPSQLNLPHFYFDVSRIRINKTLAKESKTFRSVASVQEKCGQFTLQHLAAMQAWLQHDDAVLVAHREFIDLRTYVFQHGQSDYRRCRFYLNGMVLGIEPQFKLIDAREKPRQPRSDRYVNPIADNGLWKIFAKQRVVKCSTDM